MLRTVRRILLVLVLVIGGVPALSQVWLQGSGYTGGSVNITGVSLSASDYNSGAAAGQVIGNITVSTSGGPFTGSLSLTGTDAAYASINGSNQLVTAKQMVARPYALNIVATQAGAKGCDTGTNHCTQAVTLIDALADCTGHYTYTYAATTGVCTTNDPLGCGNNMSSAIVSGGTAASNGTALASFNSEAQKHANPSVSGAYANANLANCVVLNIPAGTFQYSTPDWTRKIPKLSVVGAGSANTSLQVNNSTLNLYLGAELIINNDFFGVPAQAALYGYFINTVSAGATSVTLNTAFGESAASASNFLVGRWALVWSYSQQVGGGNCGNGASGYPPNVRYYDYVVITAVNGSTGVVTFANTPLTFGHRSDRPYEGGTRTAGTSGTCGPARITPIDINTLPVGIYHSYQGLHFLQNPSWNTGLGVQYLADGLSITGVLDTWVNDVKADAVISESSVRDVNVQNSNWVFDESDKIVRNLVYENDTIGNLTAASGAGTYSHAGQLNWHVIGGTITNWSSGDGHVPQGMTIGAQNITIDGGATLNGPTHCSIGSCDAVKLEALWPTYSVTINGVNFVGSGSTSSGAPIAATSLTNNLMTIDGTTITTNGTRITCPKSTAACMNNIEQNWGDGQPLYKSGTGFPAGCTVSAVTGDATNIYVDVTGCPTIANGDAWWATKWSGLSVTNSVGTNTGVSTWATPNLRFPNGTYTVPGIVWSGNSGN